MDDGISLEGEIALDKDIVWISFTIYGDGLIRLGLHIKEKGYLADYLPETVELSNSLSKRKFSVAQIKEVVENKEYIITNTTNYIYKNKYFGWQSDSFVSYTEREDFVRITICTGLTH